MFETLDAVEAIDDPEERSRAQAVVTAEVRKRSANWAADRGALANRIQTEEPAISIRGLARRLGVAPSTVQDLLDGYRGSGTRRKSAPKDRPAGGESE
ncbi:hypothetical protein ACWDO7_22830 [Streptomyces sp. NPDC003656]